jgi:prevent-host-death family protein
MPDITATEAARNFADLLDGVEHDGTHYTIVRRGKAVAHLEPIDRGRGKEIRDLLRRNPPDDAWSEDLVRVRALLEIDERS